MSENFPYAGVGENMVDESEEAECITGIDYFADENPTNTNNHMSINPSGDGHSQQINYYGDNQPYQVVYMQPQQESYINDPETLESGGEQDILGLPTEDLEGIHINSSPTVAASISIVPSPSNSLPEEENTHGCQLCRRKFCNPKNLLKHMQEFHHVDTNHVLERRVSKEPPKRLTAKVNNPGLNTNALTQLHSATAVSGNFIPILPKVVQPQTTVVQIVNKPMVVQSEPTLAQRVALNVSTVSRDESNDQLRLHPEASFTGELTPNQIKKAQELIVADAESFYCLYCFLRIKSRANAELHARVYHMGELPYYCNFCHVRYRSRNTHLNCNMKETSALTVNFIAPKAVVRTSTPELPASSSEISSTSSWNNVQISSLERENTWPASASPDCEVTSQRMENSSSLSENTSRTQPKKLSYNPHDYEKYITNDGKLSKDAITFSDKMIVLQKEANNHTRYQCKICSSNFSQRVSCRRHIRHVHLKEDFFCVECDTGFKTKSSLDRHRIIVHKGQPRPFEELATSVVSTKALTNEKVINDPIGVHPNLISQYMATFVVRKDEGRFSCSKCRRQFNAYQYVMSHIRQVHFGKSHLCKTCGLYFENDLTTHRSKCAPDVPYTSDSSPATVNSSATTPEPVAQADVSTEVSHLASMMQSSVQKINSIHDGLPIITYKCLLCPSTFSERSLAESHLWIEHIRSEWAQTCGNTSVDEIYIRFLQTQFSNQKDEIKEKKPATYSQTDKMSSQGTSGRENPSDDMDLRASPFLSLQDGSINYRKDGNTESNDYVADDEPINPALHCKLELVEGEGGDFHGGSNHDDSDFVQDDGSTSPIGSVDSTSRRTSTTNTITAGKESDAALKNAETRHLSDAELQQLNLKALQFIKEKQGSFVCIVCQRVSKLRRGLVDHVRRVHLCGDKEDEPVGKTPAKDYFESIVNKAVLEGLADSARETRTGKKKTVKERAAKFIRTEGPEFSCTICTIRATDIDRLVGHIGKVHFGEDEIKKTKPAEEVLRCPGCKKVMADRSFKARHIPRCALAKQLFKKQQTASSNAKPMLTLPTVSEIAGSRSNYFVESTGKIKKKPGRPFRNPTFDVVSGSSKVAKKRPTTPWAASTTALKRLSEDLVPTTPEKRWKPKQITSSYEKSKSNESSTNNKAANDQEKSDGSGIAATMTAEEVKSLIIDWSIGGKYSFFKCKQCSVLFTKYSNAETHVRKTHSGLGNKPTVNISNNARVNIKNDNVEQKAETTNHRSPGESITGSSSSEFEDGNYCASPSPDVNYSDSDQDVRDEEIPTSKPEIETNLEEIAKNVCSKKVTLNTNKFRPSTCAQVLKKNKLSKSKTPEAITSLASQECSKSQEYILKLSNNGYECKSCGKKFPRLRLIQRHIRVAHSAERLNQCQICQERFIHPQDLENHRTSCHEQPRKDSGQKANKLVGEKPVESKPDTTEFSQDNDYFTEKNIADAHKFLDRISQKKIRCKLCSMKFTANTAGLRHVKRAHFGYKPYNCPKCHERFSYDATCKNHVAVCVGQCVSQSDPIPENKNSDSTSASPTVGRASSAPQKFKCKLCLQELDDKPLFRYHLVSVHYGDLSKGKSSNFFDMIEEIIDSLTVDPPEATLEMCQQKEVEIPAASEETADATDTKPPKKKVNTSTATSEEDKPVIVHTDEKALLETLSSIAQPDSHIFIKTTVRLERFKFHGVLPESVLAVARTICIPTGGYYQCKNCAKCFSTNQGCMSHIRIVHFGEKRYQCDICLKFMTDGLGKHKKRCQKLYPEKISD